jgi:hypothetical protein
VKVGRATTAGDTVVVGANVELVVGITQLPARVIVPVEVPLVPTLVPPALVVHATVNVTTPEMLPTGPSVPVPELLGGIGFGAMVTLPVKTPLSTALSTMSERPSPLVTVQLSV